MAKIDSRFTRWQLSDQANSGASADTNLTAAEIVRELERGSREWDHDGRHFVANEAVFANGGKGGDACKAEISCGIDVPPTAIWFTNRFSVEMWGPGRPDSFADPSIAHAALEAASAVFGARWGMVAPRKFPDVDPDAVMAGTPIVGWLLYLSRRYGKPPELQTPSLVRPCADGGHLIAVTEDWLDPADPDQQLANERVHAALDAAGMLPPSAAEPIQ